MRGRNSLTRIAIERIRSQQLGDTGNKTFDFRH